MVQIALQYRDDGYFHVLALMNGCFSGLASITPGSGFIPPYFAIAVGFCGSTSSYFVGKLLKGTYKIDDVLDVFALQAVPGAIGTVLVGVFANGDMTNSKGTGLVFGATTKSLSFFAVQCLGTVVGIVWSGLWTFALLRTMKRFISVNIDAETELEGLDMKQIGEKSYRFLEATHHRVLMFELCHACKLGDFREVLRIVSAQNLLSVVATITSISHNYCYNVEHKSTLWGNYPIDEAVNPDIQEVLMNYNSPPPGKNYALYRFLRAASEGEMELLQHMVANGFDVNAVNYDNRCALHLSVCNFHVNV
ncbi:ammonium transporter AmtB, partial [Reticulomyxa filosa]